MLARTAVPLPDLTRWPSSSLLTSLLTSKFSLLTSRCWPPAARPARLQLRPIDLGAAQVDPRDFSRIRDVVQRAGVEHDEVGALARRHLSEIVESENLRGRPRRRHEDLRRRHA